MKGLKNDAIATTKGDLVWREIWRIEDELSARAFTALTASSPPPASARNFPATRSSICKPSAAGSDEHCAGLSFPPVH